MKTEILTQRFVFATITPFKDYSRLIDKPASIEHLNICGSTINNVFVSSLGWLDPDNRKSAMTKSLFLHDKNATRKKNTKYFYSRANAEENIVIESALHDHFYTTEDRHIKKHFGRPFSQIQIHIHERTIKMDGDKLYIRYNYYSKIREVNCKYFKKHSLSYGVVFDLKKGNILTYNSDNKTSKFRQSNFVHLTDVLRSITSIGIANTSNKSNSGFIKIIKSMCNEFSNNEFVKQIYHTIGAHGGLPNNIILDLTKNADELLYEWFMGLFISINKIKTPNTYVTLMHDWYPTKKYLKRNDNKLVASILDRMGIKSKSINRLIHKTPWMDLKKIVVLAKYFGFKDLHKYIHNLGPNYFSIFWEIEKNGGFETSYYYLSKQFEYDLNQTEKSNLLKLLNETMDSFTENSNVLSRTMVSQFRQLDDHFSMIQKIRTYIPETQLNATTGISFHNEHIELSKIERTIKKGYSIRYDFDSRLVKYIETPIEFIDEETKEVITFYPYLLKTDGEYSEEGAHMHHCVATYADRETSIIVSLRLGSNVGTERVTSEFNVATKDWIQSKSFCNAMPPDIFQEPLSILKNKILSYPRSIKSKGKENIPLVINGVKIIKSDETNSGYLLDILLGENRIADF